MRKLVDSMDFCLKIAQLIDSNIALLGTGDTKCNLEMLALQFLAVLDGKATRFPAFSVKQVCGNYESTINLSGDLVDIFNQMFINNSNLSDEDRRIINQRREAI